MSSVRAVSDTPSHSAAMGFRPRGEVSDDAIEVHAEHELSVTGHAPTVSDRSPRG